MHAIERAKAVIASDEVGCGPDLVRHDWNGYVFRAGDIADLALGLHGTLADEDRTATMGRHSLAIINHWGFDEDIVGLRTALACGRGARVMFSVVVPGLRTWNRGSCLRMFDRQHGVFKEFDPATENAGV